MLNPVFSLSSALVLAAVLVGCSQNDNNLAGESETSPPDRPDSLVVTIKAVSSEGVGDKLGTIKITEVDGGGVTLTPDLHSLPPGEHGFHVHENPSCDSGDKEGQPVAALAAGGHYDPDNTGTHQGPEGNGHLGDLPFLTADEDGKVTTAVTAGRLAVADFLRRSLMIHAGGDNYSDTPPMGGGGSRIACGVVEWENSTE
ncbi:MAG: superoxide dismutase [Cu-Zn] SodC [Kistimonas sp.]|nr:superoxide dismutase [Cu-Zn] SodC [Kistimonas sp.]